MEVKLNFSGSFFFKISISTTFDLEFYFRKFYAHLHKVVYEKLLNVRIELIIVRIKVKSSFKFLIWEN